MPEFSTTSAFSSTDHCAVGRALAEKWRFPSSISDTIANHHCPLTSPAELIRLVGLIQTSDYVVGVSGFEEIEGKLEDPGEIVLDHLRERSEDFQVLAEDFLVEMETLEDLFEM